MMGRAPASRLASCSVSHPASMVGPPPVPRRRAERCQRFLRVVTLVMVIMASSALDACRAGAPAEPSSSGIMVGLIIKTESNPYFVAMRQGAQQAARDNGVALQVFSGKRDGDTQRQIDAINQLIVDGATGILIAPNDSRAIVPALERARRAGILIIALDAPPEPVTAADLTFTTDNFEAGRLIGQWSRGRFSGRIPRIAFLDLNPNQITVDVSRDQGFMKGFGIDIKDPERVGDETDVRIVGHDYSNGEVGDGRIAMENLLQQHPDVNIVYTINEQAAQGAYDALRAAGRQQQAAIISVDGGCQGVQDVERGIISATVMQFPRRMAVLGVEAVARYARDGRTITAPGRRPVIHTGVELVTNDAVAGLDSKDTDWGRANCWG